MKSAENFIVSSVFSKSLSVLESLLRCWFRGYRVLLRDHSVFSFICALIRVVCIGHSSILGCLRFAGFGGGSWFIPCQ
jgi:hypothetical protein